MDGLVVFLSVKKRHEATRGSTVKASNHSTSYTTVTEQHASSSHHTQHILIEVTDIPLSHLKLS